MKNLLVKNILEIDTKRKELHPSDFNNFLEEKLHHIEIEDLFSHLDKNFIDGFFDDENVIDYVKR